MCDIVPGDIVVCVDAKPDRADPKADLLTEGRVYRAAVVGPRTGDGALAVAFYEIRSLERPTQGYAYSLRRFRKLNDERDNAELIAQIRACKPIGVPA